MSARILVVTGQSAEPQNGLGQIGLRTRTLRFFVEPPAADGFGRALAEDRNRTADIVCST